MSEGIEGSLNKIRLAMQSDPELGWAWHCNVAVCAQDEGVGHRTSNMAAARFMKMAFGFDATKTSEWRYFEVEWRKLEDSLAANKTGQ